MKTSTRQALIASAIIGLLACMVIVQWEGVGDDDDSSVDDDDSAEGSGE